ncbi:amino acid ABC transporter permease [Thioclava kandeliae]|uniref:Amino acid ABC transporter permease n=1 Tax=Thioclava kandeliae TaxID=3070818 RepID=A0ABV1SL31_9RHOB
MQLDYSIVLSYIPALAQATLMTILIAVLSQAIATVFGFLLALARMSKYVWLQRAVIAYVWIFRGTPVLLHLFFIYYAAPTFGITLEAFPAAIIAFSVSSAAYNSEIIRAGLQAVHPGQVEAAQAVGMRYPTMVLKIVLPQAVRVILPVYMSNFITHTKNSSLASVITVQELMLTSQMIYSSTYHAIEILSVAGVIYLTLTSGLTGLQLWLERVLQVEKRPMSARKRARLGITTPEAPRA